MYFMQKKKEKEGGETCRRREMESAGHMRAGGVDGKFNVTAAVADLSEGSWLTVCWPMRGVERCAHCRL